jgi:hypothetical protein
MGWAVSESFFFFFFFPNPWTRAHPIAFSLFIF